MKDINKEAEWIERRYSIMWEYFNDRIFDRKEVNEFFKEKNQDDENTVGVVLSTLKKAGRLEMMIDPVDARKSQYKLKSKQEIIKETLSLRNNKLTRSDIESILKKAADLIRTRVDYKYILVLLFLKRISDKWEIEYQQAFQEAIADGLKEDEAREEAKISVYHTFDLPDEYMWDNIRKDVSALPETLSKAMKKVSELNPDLKGVLDNLDFIQFTTNRENLEILRQLFELFSEKKFYNVSADILGDAYEWILRYFAPQKAKEGEVYTAREVIKLLVEILDPKLEESVYDPACGSGGMLILSYSHIEKKYGREKAKKLFLYGQEANLTTFALCKMNLYIHDIFDHQLASGDTLLFPKFKDAETIKQFNVVIANPPWNQDGYDDNTLKKGEFWKQRFLSGFTPNQSADWAWIQHMIASAKDNNGRVGVVIDNGCLFRGGKERAIRAEILEKGQIDTIILLPEKLFYNTGAPGALMIFNKKKSADRKEKVLFINASNEYVQHPEVRKLNMLSDENIEKIAKTFREFKEFEGFSRAVSINEIKTNDYNLNVTLYVFPKEEVEQIDLAKEWNELKLIEQEIAEVDKKIEGYLKEIGENI
jgi:type I restriction enzyme M protein